MPPGASQVTLSYLYDPLYRLTEANYSDGRYFHYAYDAVGNRLSEIKCVVVPCAMPVTINYEYDNANRLIVVNSVAQS